MLRREITTEKAPADNSTRLKVHHRRKNTRADIKKFGLNNEYTGFDITYKIEPFG